MASAVSLIPGLDAIVNHGEPRRRAEVARQIAELFLLGAANFRPDHVALFDDVLVDLVPHADFAARTDLAERLSVLANAPRGLVGQLAREDAISIAGPLLRRSPVIDEEVLVEIARIKGQGHLLAMAERSALPPVLTDVILRRGEREVIRRTAGNAGARFSQAGYSALIRRAGRDGVLTLTVGQRDDLSGSQLKDLLAGSVDIIRRRLFEVVKPARQAAIARAMGVIAVPERIENRRDFAPAQRDILALRGADGLNEGALLAFAKAHRYEESVAALSAMSGVRIATLDPFMAGDRDDPIVVIGKAIGLEWATVRALILLRLGPGRVPAPADIERARSNFARLARSTATRVVGFWQTR